MRVEWLPGKDALIGLYPALIANEAPKAVRLLRLSPGTKNNGDEMTSPLFLFVSADVRKRHLLIGLVK